MKQRYYLAEGDFVGDGAVTVPALIEHSWMLLHQGAIVVAEGTLTIEHWNYFKAVELAAVLFAFEGGKHLVYEVVDIEKLQLDAWIIDGIGQVVGKGIAEGGNSAVVVGTAPLAKEVGETVNQDS